MKGKLAVSRLSRGLRAIFALIYWSLPIKVLFNTQTFSVTSWTNNFWCFTLDFCLTLKTMFGQLDYMAEIATCPYFFGFQRTNKVNRNYFSSVEKRRIFSKRKRRQSPLITRLYGINLGVQEIRQITQLNSQKNSMFLTTWKPTKVICAKHGMLSTS